MPSYYVYILTNATRRLYVGVTDDLERRMYEHKHKLIPGLTSRYGHSWLAYYEVTEDVTAARACAKQLKGWLRSRKLTLVESMNPEWKDMSADWFGAPWILRSLRSLKNDISLPVIPSEAKNLGECLSIEVNNMPKFDLSRWDGAVDMLVTTRVEPYMNPTPDVAGRKALFRRIAGSKRPLGRIAYSQTMWSKVNRTLGLQDSERVAHVRHIVRQRDLKK